MTVKKLAGGLFYSCDNDDCKATHIAPTLNFSEGWQHAKKAGWCCAKAGDRWYHFCTWVHGVSTNQLAARHTAE